jgi:hypothetical protein
MASAGADGVATDAVPAIARAAFSGTFAALAESIGAATPVQAVASGRAFIVALTGPGAGSVDTTERSAIEHASRSARSGTIATPFGVEEGAHTIGRETLCVGLIVCAAPQTVAGAVIPATRTPLIDANAMRIQLPLGDGNAGVGLAGNIARHTGALAGDVATDPVGAETGDALIG